MKPFEEHCRIEKKGWIVIVFIASQSGNVEKLLRMNNFRILDEIGSKDYRKAYAGFMNIKFR